MVGGKIHFPFDNAGENYFSTEAYAICNGFGLGCEGGMFYFIFTEALKDNLVPVDYPDSKDSGGERISYENYFRKDTQYDLGDGTWLFRICRTGQSLSDVDRLTYQNDLGTLLVKAVGVGKIPVTEGME